ncbi:MAG: hypothetical protein ABSA02_23835 [Trebonia sp.]|jgi:hypothetical protein
MSSPTHDQPIAVSIPENITGPPQAPAPVPAARQEGGPAEAQGPAGQQNAYVYGIGQVQPRFPSVAIQKEFAQAAGRGETGGQTDRQVIASVLGDRANRYLVRQMCWVFVIEGLETYILLPNDPADYDLLVQAVRPEPDPVDVDVIVGARGPFAPPQLCNGLGLPVVRVDQLYSFDRESLIGALPLPEGTAESGEAAFRASARELFDRIIQVADNAGATDEHRALNYLAVRYPVIYSTAATEHEGNSSLAAVEVRPSRLSGVRSVVDVIFSYTHRQTDVATKYFCRVDVTEEFPFLVTKLSPFFDR